MPPVNAAPTPVQEPPPATNNMLMIAGAIGLGLLALIAAAMTMRRRRIRREEELVAPGEVAPEYEAVVQPEAPLPEQPAAPLAAEAVPAVPLATDTIPAAAVVEPATTGPCADAAPGSHVEAACEGPTEDNPSLSLKKRLKRAQFFDKREFLAEAGEVAPMAPDAGLPDAVAAPEPETPKREPV
jgi:hypothetical protein